ncbi:portal protein [Hahella ganghwensis]|uniref:portal protein n=1 Tax=Hahella ganghwensis TaxID=286420 RepID=UPI000367D318|nr:hypothetical protein [Hahella ganghwensis]
MIDDLELNEDFAAELEAAQGETEIDEADRNEGYWLRLARDAYQSSTDYLDANIRQQWEKAISHQNNEHASGSKYHTDAYRLRSKTFRPKTRTNNISAEAQLARAVFGTQDLVSVTPINDNDQMQNASADVLQQLLQYRLTHSVKWFLTVMGAYQDGRVYGVMASYQSWEYEETDEDGQTVVSVDKPIVDLLPPENIRFDPSADWRDPVNTSPYVVRLVPMYAGEAQAFAERNGWRNYPIASYISSGREAADDKTRMEREGTKRTDPADDGSDINTFELIWLHENFIRLPGEGDFVYWTIGDRLLLSDPIPISERYPHLMPGERPIVLGISLIEAHKNYPASPTKLIENLQEDVNEVANQRFDNVKLVLNKRYFVRRGSETDLQALSRNSPGSSVVTKDPDNDIRIVDTNDVTSSSYQEQDRLDLSIDEITGTFSQQSVQNNRNLNETVGGMNLMSAGADAISEYGFLIFAETWMEPVLRQLIRMEQFYETDETILAIAAEKAQLFQKFGIDQLTDDLLRSELTVTVNMGRGNTNPQVKLERFSQGLQILGGVLPGAIPRLDEDEVIKEIFGKSGYRDGQRFFKPAEEVKPQQPPVDQIAMERLKLDQQRLQLDMQMAEADRAMKYEIEMAKIAANNDLKLKDLYEKLGLEREKLATTRQIEGTKLTLEQAEKALQATNLRQGYDTF